MSEGPSKLVTPGKLLLGPSGQVLKAFEGGIKSEEEIAATRAQQEAQIVETARLQILIGKIEKAIPKRVDQRLLLSALAVVSAKTMMYSSAEKHGSQLQAFDGAIKAYLWASYPAEVKSMILDVAQRAHKANVEAAAAAIVDKVSEAAKKQEIPVDAPAQNDVPEGTASS